MQAYKPVDPAQRPLELARFIETARTAGVTRYLEVGARHGGTFHAVMSALAPGAVGVTVELPGAAWGKPDSGKHLEAAVADLTARGYHCRIVWGDSHDRAVIEDAASSGPYDLVLIDADHGLDAVTQDWRDYGPMGRLVAFHDIDGAGLAAMRPDYAKRVQVPELWAVVRREFPHVEIIDPRNRGMGIGVLWREGQP